MVYSPAAERPLSKQITGARPWSQELVFMLHRRRPSSVEDRRGLSQAAVREPRSETDVGAMRRISAMRPETTPLAGVRVVTVVAIAVVDRNDRVIVAVVEVFGGGWLVVVAVIVSGANETTGLC